MPIERLDIAVNLLDYARTRDELAMLSEDVDRTSRATLMSGRRTEHAYGMMSRGIGGLAAAVGISSVAFGVKDLAESGMNLQMNQVQLRSALHHVGITGAAAFNKVNDAASKSSESGGFGRDEQLQSMTQLIGTTGSLSEAYKANKDAVGLARAEGISYTSAQHYMAQAVVGNINRLKQYTGYITPVKTAEQKLENQHKSLIATYEDEGLKGSMLRQLEISGAITKQQQDDAVRADKLATGQKAVAAIGSNSLINSAQSKYNKTLAGQVSDLKNTFQEVEGSIGETLIPTMLKIVHAADDMAKWINKNRWAAKDLAIAVTALGAMAFGRMLYSGLRYALSPMGRMLKSLGVMKRAAMDGRKGTDILKAGLDAVRGSTNEVAMAQLKLAGNEDEAAAASGKSSKALEIQRGYATETDGAVTELAAAEAKFAATQAYANEQMERTGVTSLYLDGLLDEQAASVMALSVAEDAGAASAGILATAMDLIPGVVIFSLIGGAIALVITHLKFCEKIVAIVGSAMGKFFVGAAHVIMKAFEDMGQLAGLVWHGIERVVSVVVDAQIARFRALGRIVGGVFKDIGKFAVEASRWIITAFKNAFNYIIKNNPISGIINAAKNVMGGHFGAAAGSLLHGATFGLLNQGGSVGSHAPSKHLYTGGPAGTDTVEGWLTPGEDVISRAGASVLNGAIGQSGLSALNAGQNPFAGNGMGGGNMTITPGTTVIQLDSRTIATAVTQYALRKAARGPSSLVGGSLATGKV
jgi:hypothetical protein